METQFKHRLVYPLGGLHVATCWSYVFVICMIICMCISHICIHVAKGERCDYTWAKLVSVLEVCHCPQTGAIDDVFRCVCIWAGVILSHKSAFAQLRYDYGYIFLRRKSNLIRWELFNRLNVKAWNDSRGVQQFNLQDSWGAVCKLQIFSDERHCSTNRPKCHSIYF